jgi:1-deoxy-D-xylulose-5-phosphate reductoisomerase
MNAANEEAVSAFAEGRIAFGKISTLVGLTIDAHRFVAEPTLDDLLAADRWARQHVRTRVQDDGGSQKRPTIPCSTQS